MDDQKITLPLPSMDDTPKHLSKKTLLIGMSVGVLALFSLLLILLHGYQKKTVSAPMSIAVPTMDSRPQTGQVKTPLPFLYGAWFPNESRIYRFDPQSQASSLFVTLPFTIKKVRVLPGNQVLYINNTNSHDQGAAITVMDISTKRTRQLVTAEDGFGIDDYALSPNSRYLVDWELQLDPKTGKVKGGTSRVYTIDLTNPAVKTLLYNETADKPIHYPIAVTNTKDVYLDTYLPNSGPGFGYGMSIASFDGTQKTDIISMQNGTYSTQPRLSFDGTYLLFTGYNGSKGNGTELVDGIRTALINPTSIDIFDLKTKKRSTLSNLPKNTAFIYVSSSQSDADMLFFQEVSKTENPAVHIHEYSFKSQKEVSLSFPKSLGYTPSVIAALSPTVLLLGKQTPDTTISGNLGFHYALPFTTLTLWDTKTGILTPLPLGDVRLAQYIEVLPITAEKVLGDETNAGLQIKTFTLPTPTPVTITKPNLGTERTNQQTAGDNTPTQNIGSQICAGWSSAGTCETRAEDQCEAQCSPLYLYGPEGMYLDLRVLTIISHTNPKSGGTYHAMLSPTGKITLDKKSYASIAYNYIPRLTPPAPLYGSIVPSDKIQAVLQWYTKNLGLNERETADLLTFGKNNLFAPYTYISFYNEKISRQILPLAFTPLPDYYQNIVFYFKDMQTLPSILPLPPQFPPIKQRTGITAIEISEHHE